MTNELQIRQNQSSKEMSRLSESLFSEDKAPYYMGLAEKLARSSMVPKAYIGKPMDLFVAMAMGFSLGLSLEQSIQDIAVINSKPCLYGDGLLAVCMNHPDFLDIVEKPIYVGDKVTGYTCTIKRRDREDTVQTFTIADAKRANLLGKSGPWSQYEDRMLKMRARGFALRDSFADALRGVKSREEVEDYIDGEVLQPTRTQQLKKDIYASNQGVQALVPSHDDSTDTIATEGPEDNAMPDSGAPLRSNKVALHSGLTDVATITEEQLDMISSLIIEKAFDDERKAKAMHYFEVEELEQLSENKANRFIELLIKTN